MACASCSNTPAVTAAWSFPDDGRGELWDAGSARVTRSRAIRGKPWTPRVTPFGSAGSLGLTWDQCECGSQCCGNCRCSRLPNCATNRILRGPVGSSATVSFSKLDGGRAGSDSSTSGSGEEWSGANHGLTVQPGKDGKGNPDPCSSVITLHIWLDDASSNANGCPVNYTARGGPASDIDLEGELAEARRILEGKRFACPCAKPPGKKCWLEFRIKVHRRSDGDDPNGPKPVPVVFDCKCPKVDVDPGPNVQPAYSPPGDFRHGPNPQFHVCWPILPTGPHTMTHEVLHALGITYDQYSGIGTPNPGWEGTLIGDPHGTNVTQKDICTIAAANKACRVPGKKGKKDVVCCGEYDYGAAVNEKNPAKPAESEVVDSDGPATQWVFSDTEDDSGGTASVAIRVSEPWGI